MKWKNWTGGERLFLGTIHVATAYWDGLRPKDDPNKYTAASRLPGLNLTGHYAKLDDAKQAAEAAVKGWLQASELEQTDPAKDELADAARYYVFAMRDGPVLPRDYAHARLVEANKQWQPCTD